MSAHSTHSAKPPDASGGWSAAGVALTILLGGLSVLAVLLVWAITSPAGLPEELGTPATPAATHDVSSMDGNAAAQAAAPADASTGGSAVAAASGAKATAPAHVPFDAALPPLASGTVHHYTIRLADEVLDIADGVQ